MDNKIPTRPDTSPEVALRAIEHMTILAFAIGAARSKNPQAAIEQARVLILNVVTKDRPLTQENDIAFVEHVDWMFASAAAALAQRPAE